MKKFVLLLTLCLSFLCAYSSSGNNVIHIGMLGYLGTDEEKFQKGFDDFREELSRNYHTVSMDEFSNSLTAERRIIHFCDSLMFLLMDLKSGKIDEAILPEFTARYIMKMNSAYIVKFRSVMFSSGIAFAFTNENIALRDEFNSAITAMKADGTLDSLAGKYIDSGTSRYPAPMRPDTLSGAETITVALTGDMPPADMFAGDGEPSGYNTAILAEIGRRLGKNIRFINTDAGGRSAALFSGKADVVFWYRTTETTVDDNKDNIDPIEALFKDAPEGVILSEPYYSWNREIVMMRKERKGLQGIFSW